MDCKKALVESGGDLEAAIDYLRKKGQKIGDKRADRESNEGVVIAQTSNTGNVGVAIALNCETDFVAKNADFIDIAKQIADKALSELPGSKDELLNLDLGGKTVGQEILDQMAKIGEKIEISQYAKVESPQVVSYIHANNKIGVLVALNKAGGDNFSSAGKDTAMQIAAMNPLALNKDGITQDAIDREMAIAKDQIKAEGKPEELAEKIAMGKLNKFFKENTLLAQSFVKDNSVSIEKMLKNVDGELTVNEFKRLAIGA